MNNPINTDPKLSSLSGRNLAKIPDLSSDLTKLIIDRARFFKAEHRSGRRQHPSLNGKVVSMVFEKPSLRTKVAFEVAATSLGATPVFLSSSQIFASGNNERGRESVPDIARNLERFTDIIIARVYRHEVIQEMIESIQIPVINALCDKHHPTQALADLLTISELASKPPQETTVVFIGDGNNVATSLMHICALMGYNFRAVSPKDYEIPNDLRNFANDNAKKNGSTIEFHSDPKIGVRNADFVYTDTFTSMGQESEHQKRLSAFNGFSVDSDLMALAKPDAKFMHCLPAHRGEEVTDQVMDCKNSVVFDQAENRLHIAKALLDLILSKS